MKKILFPALAILFFVATSAAQTFHLGAKAGANLGKIDGKSFNEGFDLGYQLGAFMELDISKTLGIQPELLFSQTNTKVDSGFSAVYGNIDNAVFGEKISLNYLSIPVLLRINAGKLLTLHVGPQFSVLTNKDNTLLANSEAAFKSGNLAAVLGAQLKLGGLRVYGRYNIGLSNINDIDDQNKWKSQQVQLGLGLAIL